VAGWDMGRGGGRLVRAHGIGAVSEVSLPNGRRADVVGLSDKGGVWIIEIKSSLEDFRADHKWGEYRDYCDELYFAVSPRFPASVLPADAGLIIADRYGGEIIRRAQQALLAPARRKKITLEVARTALLRLRAVLDPAELPFQPGT